MIEGVATFETDAIGDPTAETTTAEANGDGSGATTGPEDATDGSDTGTDRVTVEAGEAIRFAPGEYQRGRNESSSRVVALALGAPRDAGETDVRRECIPCGEYTSQAIEMTEDRDALVTRCVECGAETGRFG